MLQIRILQNGLESSMAHYISQGLVADPRMDVERALDEFRSLFLENFKVPQDVVEEMIANARDQGLMEYAMGLSVPGVDAAAQIHPSANPAIYRGAEQLSNLLKQHMEVR